MYLKRMMITKKITTYRHMIIDKEITDLMCFMYTLCHFYKLYFSFYLMIHHVYFKTISNLYIIPSF